jgi:L-ascorbate metabolism protein UlaG (beta-lactamase superfamily)
MFKTLFFIFILMQVSISLAKVEMRWLTVSSVLLDDGESKILFDSMFTRASALNWLNLKKLKSDEELVKRELKSLGILQINGIFVSHSHFDHVIDAPIVAKLTGATFYADKSNERIAKAYKEPLIKTSLITAMHSIRIGKFNVTPILRTHSPIAFGIDFLPGEVKEDFDFDFYDYRMGETWFYLVTHPDGKILIDQGSAPFVEKVLPLTHEVDALIQGVANRKTDEQVIDGYIAKLNPKVFVPTHFDNFIFEFDPKSESELPGLKLHPLLDKIREKFGKMKVIKPKYGEKIELLK